MNSFFMSMLLGPAPGGEPGTFDFTALLPIVAIIAIFYFLILRPQNKKQKETQKMLSALKKGDMVVTIGGIHGIIHKVTENSIILKVDDNVKLKFNRGAISSVTSQDKDDKEDKKALENKENENESSESED